MHWQLRNLLFSESKIYYKSYSVNNKLSRNVKKASINNLGLP